MSTKNMHELILDQEKEIKSQAKQIESLQAENAELESCLKEAVDLMDDILLDKYAPDSFTTQPWRKALSQSDQGWLAKRDARMRQEVLDFIKNVYEATWIPSKRMEALANMIRDQFKLEPTRLRPDGGK